MHKHQLSNANTMLIIRKKESIVVFVIGVVLLITDIVASKLKWKKVVINVVVRKSTR